MARGASVGLSHGRNGAIVIYSTANVAGDAGPAAAVTEPAAANAKSATRNLPKNTNSARAITSESGNC